MKYDAIIIGGGPAALTAALYLGRYNVPALIVADVFRGQAAIAGTVENFPGFDEINGAELIAKMKQKVQNLKSITVKSGERATRIEGQSGSFKVSTTNDVFEGKTVIIASGSRHRSLELEGEEGLVGKGLSYCATCDGTFAKDKDVAVIGGGNSAIEAALILEKVAKSVTMINIGEKLSGEILTEQKTQGNPKIIIINSAQTTKIEKSENQIAGVEYLDKKTNETKKIPVQMIFVEIGQVPNSESFKDVVDVNQGGEIIIDAKTCQSSTEGIWAAGDVTDLSAKQIIIACGEGAKAAISVNRYLHQKPKTN